MSSKVSVVIPTYNRATLIERSINSVLKQTYQNFEILIIDDASVDETNKVVQSINDERIHYYKLSSNSGGGVARNKGIELANGDFVAFLDSDDEWQPNMLESCFEKFNRLDERNAIIFSKLLMDNKSTKKVFPESIYLGGDLSNYIFCKQGLVSTITIFLPTGVARKIMFKDDLVKHQDYDFVLRAYKQGVKFYMIDKVLAIWHNEKRSDRMGVKVEYEDSLKWLSTNNTLFTPQSAKMFVKRDILGQVLREKNSMKAIKFLIKLKLDDLLNYTALVKSILKILLNTSK